MSRLVAFLVMTEPLIMNATRVRRAAQTGAIALQAEENEPGKPVATGWVSCFCKMNDLIFIADTYQPTSPGNIEYTEPCTARNAKFNQYLPVATRTGECTEGARRHPADGKSVPYEYACVCYGHGMTFVYGDDEEPMGLKTWAMNNRNVCQTSCDNHCSEKYDAVSLGCFLDGSNLQHMPSSDPLKMAVKPNPQPETWAKHGHKSCYCSNPADHFFIAKTAGEDDWQGQCPDICHDICQEKANGGSMFECLPVFVITGRITTPSMNSPRNQNRYFACVCNGHETNFVYGVSKGIKTWVRKTCERLCPIKCFSMGAIMVACRENVPEDEHYQPPEEVANGAISNAFGVNLSR